MDFISQGKTALRKGIAHDNRGELPQAKACYEQGVSHFLAAIKYIKTVPSFKVLQRDRVIYGFPRNRRLSAAEEQTLKDRLIRATMTKAQQFLGRAEDIGRAMGQPPAGAGAGAGAGASSSPSASGSGSASRVRKPPVPAVPENETDDQRALRESIEDSILKSKPNVRWEDVAGQAVAKKALEEALILPQRYPQLFVGKRKPWKAVLLYGPPGTGKSFLAKAVATRCGDDFTFYSVSSSNLVSKWLGESEKLVRALFEMALRDAPSIVFIDEIDSIATRRSDEENEATRRIKTEFMVQLNRVLDSPKQLVVLGATNRPFDLDPAMRRRFEKRICIPLPDYEARKGVLRVHAKNDIQISDDEYHDLAQRMEGYSCADINVCVRNALMQPVRISMKCKFFLYEFASSAKASVVRVAPIIHDVDAVRARLTRSQEIRELDIMDIDNAHAQFLEVPEPSVQDIYDAMAKTPPTVSAAEVRECERFTQLYGVEG